MMQTWMGSAQRPARSRPQVPSQPCSQSPGMGSQELQARSPAEHRGNSSVSPGYPEVLDGGLRFAGVSRQE
jgi:hypothetical protein